MLVPYFPSFVLLVEGAASWFPCPFPGFFTGNDIIFWLVESCHKFVTYHFWNSSQELSWHITHIELGTSTGICLTSMSFCGWSGGEKYKNHFNTTVKLSPHSSPHSSSHSSTHSPHIRPTFIMRLYKQIKTTCGTLTISNHSKSLYLYIKLLAFQILYILVWSNN